MRTNAAGPDRSERHRYIIEDPVRFGCLCAAAALLFVPQVPFGLTLLVVAVTQLAPVFMAGRALQPGWSQRWGRSVHASVYASNLAMDFTNLAACSVVGAMLLIRNFNGIEPLRPLAILAAAICLLPDVRLCRWILAGEPVRASFQLRSGGFFRDPVLLSVLLATGVVLALDRTSLHYLLLSLGLLQINTILVLVDKYLPEIEATRWTGGKALLLEREGRQLWLTLAPLLLAAGRHFSTDRAALWGAGLIAFLVVLPDLLRLSMSLFRRGRDLFRMTPAAGPATYVVLPR
jgi:hypothetical protein